MKATKENFGKLIWNGNELVFANSPNVGVAGIAPGMPDELGEEIARRCTAVDALQERVRELEGGMREIMVSVGRVEPKDGHPEFGYIYSVAKALLKGE